MNAVDVIQDDLERTGGSMC